jgi:hypothetical protein
MGQFSRTCKVDACIIQAHESSKPIESLHSTEPVPFVECQENHVATFITCIKDLENFIERYSKELGDAHVCQGLLSLMQRFVDANASPDCSSNYRSATRDSMSSIISVLQHESLEKDAEIVLLCLTVRNPL